MQDADEETLQDADDETLQDAVLVASAPAPAKSKKPKSAPTGFLGRFFGGAPPAEEEEEADGEAEADEALADEDSLPGERSRPVGVEDEEDADTPVGSLPKKVRSSDALPAH